MPNNLTTTIGLMATQELPETGSPHAQKVVIVGPDAAASIVSALYGLSVDVKRWPVVSNRTIANVNVSAAAVELALANASRIGLQVLNDSVKRLMISYLLNPVFGVGYSQTHRGTTILYSGQTWEMPQPIDRGTIWGIWEDVDPDGLALVTELT